MCYIKLLLLTIGIANQTIQIFQMHVHIYSYLAKVSENEQLTMIRAHHIEHTQGNKK